MEKKKVPIDKHVVLMRMRRKLKQKNQELHLSRSQKAIQEFGECYGTENDNIVWSHKSLEELAREMDCLKAYERIEE